MTFLEFNIHAQNIGEQESTATQYNMTMGALEIAVDDALKKADFNYDGMISWQEYVYSLSNINNDESSEEHGAPNAPSAPNQINDGFKKLK